MIQKRNQPPRKVIKATVKCECGFDNALELRRAQLRNIRATCCACGKAINLRWNVKSA
jgi:hypothetical protein